MLLLFLLLAPIISAQKDADELAADVAPVGKTFARCGGPVTSFEDGGSGYMLNELTVSLELSVPSIDTSYLWEYRAAEAGARRGTWVLRDGTTALHFSANVTESASAVPIRGHLIVATAHAATCAPELEQTHKLNEYRHNSSLPPVGTNILAIQATSTAQSPVRGAGTVPWLASVDRIQSVVLSVLVAERIVALGCCSLIPRMPALPRDWVATIEANFLLPAQDKMYTVNRQELYSESMDAVRISSGSHDHSVVHIQHFVTNESFSIHANDNFPDGVCERRQRVKGVRQSDHFSGPNNHLRSTVDLLLSGHSGETYVGTGCADCDVRGVPCEKWVSQVAPVLPGGTAYNVSYYFMEMGWRSRHKEMWHRHLRRVVLEGSGSDGSRIKDSYEFVHFDSIEPKAKDFNPCMVFAGLYPRGDGSDCDCVSNVQFPATSCDSPDEESSLRKEVFKASLFVVLGITLALTGICIQKVVRRQSRASSSPKSQQHHSRFEDTQPSPSSSTIGRH